jgi:predicted Fe-Mo cluster-binding NifX family protein
MQLEERVRRLERSGKVWRAVAVILGVALVAAAQRAPVSEEVVTRQLRIVDDKGQNVLVAGEVGNRSVIELSRKGVSSVLIQAGDQRSMVGLNLPGKEEPAILMTGDGSGGFVYFEPKNANNPTGIGSNNGVGFVQIRGADDTKVFHQP